ncbi:MAG TPA: hypothetical protein VNJ05_08420 [Sphingomicrobium sp.]|nr:hypothetical protein [Sphingomicrobium sp.]
MSEPPKVAAARIEVERAKGALLDTARELIDRFKPHNIVDDLWESAKNKGADLAEDAVDAVAKRPLAVGGAVTALAMFIAREPLKAATVKFYDAMTPLFEPREKRAALKAKQAAAKPAGKVERSATPAAKPVSSKVERRTTRAPRRAPHKKTEKA